MTDNITKRGAALAAMLLATATLQAGMFEGSTTGEFKNPVPEDPGDVSVFVYFPPSKIEWGVPITGRSSLEFEGANFATDLGQTFLVGTLVAENQTIQIGTGLTAVDLDVTFTFTIPEVDQEFTYTINLVNTINTGDTEGDADVITMLKESPCDNLIIGDQAWTLSVWFGDVVGDGHVEPGDPNTFHVHEGRRATVQLLGRITVPDGGLTIALLGAALGGVGLLNRKMRK